MNINSFKRISRILMFTYFSISVVYLLIHFIGNINSLFFEKKNLQHEFQVLVFPAINLFIPIILLLVNNFWKATLNKKTIKFLFFGIILTIWIIYCIITFDLFRPLERSHYKGFILLYFIWYAVLIIVSLNIMFVPNVKSKMSGNVGNVSKKDF